MWTKNENEFKSSFDTTNQNPSAVRPPVANGQEANKYIMSRNGFLIEVPA